MFHRVRKQKLLEVKFTKEKKLGFIENYKLIRKVIYLQILLYLNTV